MPIEILIWKRMEICSDETKLSSFVKKCKNVKTKIRRSFVGQEVFAGEPEQKTNKTKVASFIARSGFEQLFV